MPYDREQRTHISVGLLIIQKPPIPGLIHVPGRHPAVPESVFAEDRTAVEPSSGPTTFSGPTITTSTP